MLSFNVLSTATLKNDNPEDESDAEGEDEGIITEKTQEKRLLDKDATSNKTALDKQPTGRIVGIMKRNWRA